jgi:iron complex outermembrane receptor protein
VKVKQLAQVVSLLCLASPVALPAFAQTPEPAAPQKVERVEITGSSIKRIQAEGALPIQVITSRDLAKSGITTAEQLVSTLSVNGAGIDNMTTQQGFDFLSSTSSRSLPNNGSASASLRGFGPQYTLILLNGRRVAAHGLSGKAVDLNSIPLAAVDRIEILKDGASAIYGADAVGGVINFILRKDVKGLEGTVFGDVTEHRHGDKYRASLLGGFGDVAKDRYNLMASITFDTNNRLRGSQRDFNNGVQPDLGLFPDTTGTPFANIGMGIGGTALSSTLTSFGPFGPTPSGLRYSRVNLLALTGACATVPGMSAYRGDVTGSFQFGAACAFDYGKEWSMMQPVDRVNVVSRGTYEISADHRAFVEVTASRVKSSLEYTPIQLTGRNYPAFITDASGARVRAPYYQDLTGLVPGFNNQLPERIRWRCLPCGPRQQDTETKTSRALLALDGIVAGWDYKLGFSKSRSQADTVLGDGNMYADKINAALDSGLINPFVLPGQSQTAQATALIEAAKARGLALFGGRADSSQFDGNVSREVMQLPAGPMAVAVGFDSRKEEFLFNKEGAAATNINGTQSPASLPRRDRRITAFYSELQVPLAKGLDAQLAVRRDKYSDFGSTTNPKLAVRWQPTSDMIVRSSYSRGFHAPDFDALYGGDTVGQFNSDINDPVLCPTGRETTGCGIRPAITGRSNPNLKPEKSKQYSTGIVFQPIDWFSASIDYWNIELTDRIGALSPLLLVSNYAQYQQFVIRDASGQISEVIAPTFNLAGDRTKGFDISLASNWKNDLGKFTAKLDGTYVKSYETRFSSADPWAGLVSQFGDTVYGYTLHLRWRHTASLTWDKGNWSSTLSQSYTAGYLQEKGGFVGFTPPQLVGKSVSPYQLYHLTTTYSGFKNLSLTGGIRNLFDTKPPFSGHNVDNVAGAGWDARVGDPRMRSFVLSATYKFY